MVSESFLEDHRLELENRIKNLMWTVSGDYTLEIKPNVEAFLNSKNEALYEGIKQGGLARFYDRNALSLYLVKKVYCHAMEGPLMSVAQMCIDAAVASKLDREREGIRRIRRRAYEEILENEFQDLTKSPLGQLKIELLREELSGPRPCTAQMQGWLDQIHSLRDESETEELIRTIDRLYNQIVEPKFPKSLSEVLAVTIEELTEFSWKDFLSEEMLEDNLEIYLDKVTENMTGLNHPEVQEKEEKQPEAKKKVVVAAPEALEKMYSYVERNFGATYLTPAEEKSRNYQMCRGIHGDCSLYYTEGVLRSPVLRNYQYEYAKRNQHRNTLAYYDNHRIVKRNIQILTDMLRKALVLRDENQEVRSDHGRIIPGQLWKIGRSQDNRVFSKEIKDDSMEFVVDVLIDASGSQQCRQSQVALQAYILSEAMTALEIPTRVMSFCTFWDYTVLQRFRDYDDDRRANAHIFEFVTSSNNRDGLAIRAVGNDLLQREEKNKVLIVLSDGKPYDVLVTRPNAKNPQPYSDKPALLDTGFEVRRLRQNQVAVLGVFVGEESELAAEKKIFGKDFAYTRSINNFSKVVGRYLLKQIEE